MQQRSIFPVLMVMVLLSPLAIDIFLPSLPEIATEFNVSSREVQSTLILYLFAMGIGQIFIGPLADRFGRRPIAMMGICLYFVSSIFAAISPEFHYLQLARVLQGIAACATSIVVFSAVRDSFSVQESARYYSYLNGAICVVPALAPTFGGLLALQFGWRSTFLFMALFSVFVLVYVCYKLPETRPENTKQEGALYHWERYTPILRNKHFLFYALLCMSGMASLLTYVSYAPNWLISHLGLTELTFSALFGLNALVNIMAAFIAPTIIKRFTNRFTVILALFLFLFSAAVQIVLQPYAPDVGIIAGLIFMLPMMLLCVGFALLLGPVTSMALSEFGDRAGTATAMLGCIQMSGAALLSALVQQSNLTAPYAVSYLTGGLMLIFLFMLLSPKLSHIHQSKCMD